MAIEKARIEEPLTALAVFFIAVVMVILATYLLFIAGSVALCKLLQRKKNYYYKPNHFVAVSSMAFRMKRNGAGLASICILATMVLVMISSTSCLYFGGEDALRAAYPYDVAIHLNLVRPALCTEENFDLLRAAVHEQTGGRESGVITYASLETSGSFADGVLSIDGVSRGVDTTTASALLEQVRGVCILPLSDYNRLAGAELTLSPGEALIWSSGKPYEYDTFTVEGCGTLRVRGTLSEVPIKVSSNETIATNYYVFVPDWADYATRVDEYVDGIDDWRIAAIPAQYCCFDLPGVPLEEQMRVADLITYELYHMVGDTPGERWASVGRSSYAESSDSFFSLYGSLFFLGIVLSIVFIAAAALIIYYKQLSEGYEDESRFDIMQKVGMTKREIKSAVNSQVLTVFFAPLLLAGVHLVFAFPFVHKIVRLFGVTNTPLLILTNVACFLAFALFYVFVYRETAKAYYAIVSDGEARR